MSIINLRAIVKERLRQLDFLINEEGKVLQRAPEGRIKIGHRSNGSVYYVMADDDGDKYLSVKDKTLAKSLIQKSYNQKILKAAIDEKRMLVNLMENYPKTIAEEIYSSLSKDRQQLISPIIIPDDEYIRKWESKTFTPKPFDPDDPEYYSNKGERVRSKSEKIIADRLYARNVPYRYECPLDVPELGIIHPDFTILNIYKRKEVYLEHCGMMGDPGYVNKLIRRNNCYSKAGIILGDRLFMSFESDKYPLDTRALDNLIDQITTP